jgi:hypothetical protein
MRFVVESGTEIRKYVEHCEDIASALKCVERLIAYRRPNIRVFDENGRDMRVDDLRRLTGAAARATPNLSRPARPNR